MQLIEMTPETFGGVVTGHGRIAETDRGTWLALGHLTPHQFTEAFNEANRALETGAQIADEFTETWVEQRWAVLETESRQAASGDEWQIRYVDQGDPGAVALTVLL